MFRVSNLLTPHQSGFRKGHSTTSALLKVHDDIHEYIDKKGVAFLLLVDFSKAFDRVSHTKLLIKLSNNFSFSREAVYLINSYLSHRTQVVEIDGVLSRSVEIMSGVPQGSVLGPLLFSLFINDLPTVLKYCMIHIFADDVQLYFCSLNLSVEEMARFINSDLENICRWSERNLLPINASKTKVMFVSRRHRPCMLPDIIFNHEVLDYVEKISNLGVIFQQNLEWESHINSQCSKIYAGLRHLRLTAIMLSVPVKIRLFKSLLLPHFTYGLELTSNASVAAFNRLRIALNACVRWIFSLTTFSRVSHLHHQLLGSSFCVFLKIRYISALLKIIYHGPCYLFDKLRVFRGTRTRSFVLPQINTSHYRDSFFVRAIILWNQLPAEIKLIHSRGKFNRRCIDWLEGRN